MVKKKSGKSMVKKIEGERKMNEFWKETLKALAYGLLEVAPLIGIMVLLCHLFIW